MTDSSDMQARLTAERTSPQAFADTNGGDIIDLSQNTPDERTMYRMPTEAATLTKSKSQMYYEEVEELKTKGVSNADAIRQVANKHGASENAVRGGIYQYSSKQGDNGTSKRTRRTTSKTASVDDLLDSAKKALQDALLLIDQEVEQAKAAFDEAKANYDQIQASVKDRKADIEKKLKALS